MSILHLFKLDLKLIALIELNSKIGIYICLHKNGVWKLTEKKIYVLSTYKWSIMKKCIIKSIKIYRKIIKLFNSSSFKTSLTLNLNLTSHLLIKSQGVLILSLDLFIDFPFFLKKWKVEIQLERKKQWINQDLIDSFIDIYTANSLSQYMTRYCHQIKANSN